MDKPKHIAYLSYDGLTDPLGQSQIIPYVLGLSALGYQFTIISFEKKNVSNESHQQVQTLLTSHHVAWHPLSYTKRPPVLSTLWDIIKLWRAIITVHKTKPIQLVHCRSYITALAGLRFKRKLGVPFLFDMRGFWADERVEGNIWNIKHPLYRLVYNYFKQREKVFWHEAGHIISLTENAQQEIIDLGVRTPITVIPTCVDLQYFDIQKLPADNRVKQRNNLGISANAFLLVYAGSWGTWYLTDEIIHFFQLLRQKKNNAHLLILSPDAVNIPEAIKPFVTHRKAVRADMPGLLASADASVFFIKPSYSKKASSATKLGELLAMQLPVVTNGGWGDIQGYNGNGIMVLPDTSVEKLTLGAQWLLQSNPDWPNSHLEKLSLTHGIKQYQYVYTKLLV
jgi:glycosyltransferase involved in cell wall biosynthesis